ncbi:hypothetical protein F5883DRAFT_239074 [Diaporthe sp. PMI_573]|nr:hypothetical protein F5883DRAFT_239074 [Diaporthaceae sp. PMI_573]
MPPNKRAANSMGTSPNARSSKRARLSPNSPSNLQQSGNAEQRKLGLNQVYPDRSDNSTRTEIDIVAIHGLDTHSPKTWVAWKDGDPASGEVHWLKDRKMLPAIIPNARIFTYDWNANFHQDASAQGLLGHADDLLETLHIRRSKDDSINRPIVFVASCFGGLLLCKALYRASEEHSNHRHIFKSTGGVAFLGTPFRGSNSGFLTATQLRLNVAISMGGETADELIKYLSNKEGERRQLDEIVQLFCELANTFKLPIRCFYETHRTDFKKFLNKLSSEYRKELGDDDTGILVPEHSACLDSLPRSALPVRHGMLNKFAGPEDQAFDRVSHYLKEFAEKALQMGPDARIRKNHYTADRLKIERLSGDQLSMDQCYINLTIVEQPGRDAARSRGGSGKGDTPPQSSPFSLPARLKIETSDKNIQVELAKIFDPRKGPDGHTTQPRRILIRGRAGVGKTTLCKRMVHDFLRGTWKELFDRILWVPLRTLKRKPDKGYNLEGLFLRDFFSNAPNREGLAKELENALHATKFDRTLFVLDGLDEVSEGFGKDNEMHDFLIFLLERPNVIITSRPSARLPDHLHPDLELETIGFYPDQVEEYIEGVFRGDRQKADDIQSFLQQRLLIQSLVRIPIQLDALCYIWDKDSKSGLVSEAMTPVYQAIEERLWTKDVLRLEKEHNRKPVTAPDIQNSRPNMIRRFVESEIRLLEGLAFTGLHNDVIDFEPRHWDATFEQFAPSGTDFWPEKELPHLSFLRTSDASSENRNYHFLHLTYQEYFAAKYFKRQWTSGQELACLELKTRRGGPVNCSKKRYTAISYLQKHKYNARYDIFWRFVAGLLDASGDEEQLCRFFRTIEDEPRDLLGPVHQRLVMHCLSELSTEMPFRESLEKKLKEWLLFECEFTEHARLASEAEFPEQALLDVLHKAPDNVKIRILESLERRPTIPPSVFNQTLSWLENSQSSGLVIAVLSMLRHFHTDLSDKLVSAVARRLDDEDRDVRNAAVEVLRGRSDLSDELVSAVARRLDDKDGYVRNAAVEVLRGRSDLSDELVSAVARRLDDKDRYVRRAAVWVLGGRSDLSDELVSAVARRLDDEHGNVRGAAVWVLGGRSDLSDELVSAVARRLDDEDKYVRNAAVEVLRGRSDLSDELVSAVARRLDDKDRYVRRAAVWVLGGRSDLSDELVSAVARRLDDKDRNVRNAAVEVLGGRSDLSDELVSAVARRLDDKDGNVRRAAVWVLRGRSDLSDELVSAVARRLDDKDRYVRRAAVEVLGGRSDLSDELVSAVARRLDDKDRNVRRAAVWVLGGRSDLSDELVSAVARRLDDEDKYVRNAAVEVLRGRSDLSDKLLSAVLSSPLIGSLYQNLLMLGFEEQWSWYIENGTFCVNMPDGTRIDNIEFMDMAIKARPPGFPSMDVGSQWE